MGLLDSVTSGIGSVANALDVGNAVKGAVDGVLPKNMAFVGDLAGAAVDYETGNYIGAAKLGFQALKDLPQTTSGQQAPQHATAGGTNNGPSSPKPALEPSPPPLASRAGKPFDWNDLLSAIKALTAALNGQSTSAAGKPAASGTSQASNGASAAAPANTSAPAATTPTPASTSTAPAATTPTPASTSSSTTTTTTTTRSTQQRTGGWRNTGRAASTTTVTTTVTTGSNGATTSAWKGQPTTAAPAASQQAATSSPPAAPNPMFAAVQAEVQRAVAAVKPSGPSTPASAPAASAPASASSSTPTPANTSSAGTAGATKSSGTSSAAGNGQAISSLSQMQGMSNAAFMDAVSNGRISPDLAKDPAAMMAIQQRMNDISQMNNLMTAMMRAMHDMQMAVIQNIRI